MDTNNLIIFYNRPQDMLGIGIIGTIILLLYLLHSWRSRNRVKLQNFFIIIAVLAFIGPGLIGIYVLRGGKPAERLAVNSTGVWCRSWDGWIPWQEISHVDAIDDEFPGRGEHRGVSATFDLTDSGVVNHYWVPIVKYRKQAKCVIDNLDRPTEEIFRILRKYSLAAP